jgi:acetyl-CoA synthetase/medium-chain acyl-CoA synthetase
MGEKTAPAMFNFTRDVVEHWAQVRPRELALWCIDVSGVEQRLGFAEIADRSRRAAHRYHQAGVRRGDCVLVMLPRVPMWWVGMLGLIRLGAVPIPATTLLTAKDIAYRIDAADITAVLTDADGAAKLGSFPGRVFLADELERDLANASPSFESEPTRADDPGLIYFTSGTTGLPKMVLHTQDSYGRGHRITGAEWLCCKPGDVHWNLADTGWAKAAWSSFFGPWHMGACIFSVDARGKFDPQFALRILSRYPVTSWCAPPTALRLIVREDLQAFRFPHLHHCVSAGEPLNPEVIQTWKAATALTIHEGYGQSETVVLIANLRGRGDEVVPGSMGRPTPGFEVALLGDDLSPVREGEEGEIAVRVKPQRPLGLFREYWRNAAENESRFRGEWYLTGDRAKQDERGRFWFIGRTDDVIKSAGYRIGPFEVESALIEHPDVIEAAVVAKPDDIRGAIVRAFVVLRKGCSPCDELRHTLQEHCKQTTAPYKYPREIEFVTELPKTISGKIRRVELREFSEQ